MPPITTDKPAKKPAKAKAQKPLDTGRPIIYPHLETLECFPGGLRTVSRNSGQEEGGRPISVAAAKALLGWETEDEYIARMTSADNTLKPSELRWGDDVMLSYKIREGGKDVTVKVRCWNNSDHKTFWNRPFRQQEAEAYAQTLLNRQWAGPTCMPGETVNAEPVIIGRTGRILSGQHRLVMLILAAVKWAGNGKAHYAKLWPEEPVLDCLVVRGQSEANCVVQTLDNVAPRSLDDVYFTTDVIPSSVKSVPERKEFARMMSRATALLWDRTGAGDETGNPWHHRRTHVESTDFLARHPKLKDCVLHLFEENKERAISNLKLSAGQMAAMCYLMGCSESDGNEYRNAREQNEKKLDWSSWDRAKAFFAELAADKAPIQPVRHALAAIADAELNLGGRDVEKRAILCRAWQVYKTGKYPTEQDLDISDIYYKDKNDETRLQQFPDVGGIDLGDGTPPDPDEIAGERSADPTPDEIEAEKVRLKKERFEEQKRKLAEARAAKKNGRAPTRKQVEAEQTRKAAEADAETEPEDEQFMQDEPE